MSERTEVDNIEAKCEIIKIKIEKIRIEKSKRLNKNNKLVK
jgi:hypothetical protein